MLPSGRRARLLTIARRVLRDAIGVLTGLSSCQAALLVLLYGQHIFGVFSCMRFNPAEMYGGYWG
jgi:hypothetical protein